MTWTPTRISLLKLALFTPAIAYFAIDLWLWQGPVWQLLHPEKPQIDTSILAAEVMGEPIPLAQLARYEAEQDMLAGRSAPEAARRPLYLMDMVRHSLLHNRTRYNDKNLPPCREEAEAEVARLASRYPSDAAFTLALASQGYTRDSFTRRVQAHLREFALLERALAPHAEPGDADVAAAYEAVKDELRLPEQRELRHIFLATLNKDAEAVRARAQALLDRLNSGQADFATLARAESEDARSAPRGGALGRLAHDSSNPLPELPLFGEKAIPAGAPTLAQSRWGWHLLLAGEPEPARIPSFEECRESLRSALRSARREAALRTYQESDLKTNRKRIIFHNR